MSWFKVTRENLGSYKRTRIAAQFWLDRQLDRQVAVPQPLIYPGAAVDNAGEEEEEEAGEREGEQEQ